jgi:hypothetical protein
MRAVVDCRHTVILGWRSSRSHSSARADPDGVEPERLGLRGEASISGQEGIPPAPSEKDRGMTRILRARSL